MDNPNPFMHMMPFPWWMYQQPHQQQQQQYQIPDIIVPARVNKAMEFFSMVSRKTATMVAANDISIEQVPGQQLSDEEQNAMASACNLLSQYFAGKLQPDAWEALKVEGTKKQIERGGVRGRLIHCLACQGGPGRTNCQVCEGLGSIIITPVGPTPESASDDDE